MVFPYIFPVIMPSEQVFAVTALTVPNALTAVRASLPHFQPTENEREAAVNVGGDVRYTLTCLLCGAVNPKKSEAQSLLVAMQEHLMGVHGLTQDDFRESVKVFTGAFWEGQYVWVALSLGSAPLAYVRASRYTTAARTFPAEELRIFTPDELSSQIRIKVTTLRLVSALASDTSSMQEVKLLGEDEDAWYGYAVKGDLENLWFIWPKQAWKKQENN